jgi:dTDP-4-dehydrorhamnose reductase
VGVVGDQVVTPTYTADLACKVNQLIGTDGYGLYHVTNKGLCSWFKSAHAIFEFAGLKADLASISSEAFGAPARRPRYSVLRNRRLELVGLDDLAPWQDALKRYLAERRKASASAVAAS